MKLLEMLYPEGQTLALNREAELYRQQNEKKYKNKNTDATPVYYTDTSPGRTQPKWSNKPKKNLSPGSKGLIELPERILK